LLCIVLSNYTLFYYYNFSCLFFNLITLTKFMVNGDWKWIISINLEWNKSETTLKFKWNGNSNIVIRQTWCYFLIKHHNIHGYKSNKLICFVLLTLFIYFNVFIWQSLQFQQGCDYCTVQVNWWWWTWTTLPSQQMKR